MSPRPPVFALVLGTAKKGTPVLVFSDRPRFDFMETLLLEEVGAPSKESVVYGSGWPGFHEAALSIAKLPILIDDETKAGIEVRAKMEDFRAHAFQSLDKRGLVVMIGPSFLPVMISLLSNRHAGLDLLLAEADERWSAYVERREFRPAPGDVQDNTGRCHKCARVDTLAKSQGGAWLCVRCHTS